MQSILDTLTSLPAFMGIVLGFGFLIFIHELGHFLAAKWVGIKVTQFAIGFGPSMVAWRKGIGFQIGSTEPAYEKLVREATNTPDGPLPAVIPDEFNAKYSETEYRLNYLPLGGYVKMLGQEDLDPAARSSDPRSFNAKSVGARAIVVSAGVVMNLIFGILFFIAAFMIGVPFPPAVVGNLDPDGPAARATLVGQTGADAPTGLQPGDRILSIDGEPTNDFVDLAMSAALAEEGKALRMDVARTVDGKPATLAMSITPEPGPDGGILWIGVQPPMSLAISKDKDVVIPAELQAAGVKPGMAVVEAAGKPVQRFDQFSDAVESARGQSVPVTFASMDGQAVERVTVNVRSGLLIERENENAKDGPASFIGLIPPARVEGVLPRSPAEKAGLQQGDLIARIGTVGWPSPDQLVDAVSTANRQPLKLVVWRDGKEVDLGEVTPGSNNRIGVQPGYGVTGPFISGIMVDGPCAKLNLPAGSRLVRLNDKPLESYADLQRAIAALAAPVEKDKKPADVTVNVTFRVNLGAGVEETHRVILPGPMVARIAAAEYALDLPGRMFEQETVLLKGDGPVDAAMIGLHKSKQVMVQNYVTLVRLFQGSVPTEKLSGPLGIAADGTRLAKRGFAYLIFFLGFISLSLVVMNFLPIPVVDGGLMVFLIIEKLKGSPVSPKIQATATYVGLAAIGCLFLYVTFNDFVRVVLPLFS